MSTPHPLAAAAGRLSMFADDFSGAGADHTRVHLGVGRLIPGTRYVIRRWLGEGGMGVVYEAEHADVHRRVALKLLRPEYTRDQEAVKLFRAEARTTSGIGSEHIVEIYDFAELADGRLGIAMELLEGQELTPSLQSPMDPGRAIGILRQVCRGLYDAHKHGLVHRDVKPENVFLTRHNGRPDRVKLLDFGIAVMVADDYTHRPLAGTPLYLAPEAIHAGKVGPAADIYAVGCMAWEMLTGKPAFMAPSLAEILRAHLELTPEPPSRLTTGISPALDAVVMRALAKYPEQRFSSMADFEAALCEAQVAARIVTPWDDLPLPADIEPGRRDRLLRSMPEPEAEPRPRRSPWLFVLAGVGAFAVGSGLVYQLSRPDAAPVAESQASIETRETTQQARDAAAAASWVYPPADNLQATTAYQAVLHLETLEEPGPEMGRELRREFAATLTRLGNEFWESEAGRPFARGYYEQALMFDSYAQPASERVSLDQAALSALQDRAGEASFTLDDLILAEPLMVLAAEDEVAGDREERLQALREADEAMLTALDERVDALSRMEKPRAPTPRTVDISVLDEDETQAAEDEKPPPARSPKKARGLSKRGAKALAAGEQDEAEELFERALALNRRDVRALAGMRDLYFDRGDYGRAVRFGKRAVAVASRGAEHHLRLGDAYYKVARYTEAQTEYAAALRLGEARAKWRLDKARKKLGSG